MIMADSNVRGDCNMVTCRGWRGDGDKCLAAATILTVTVVSCESNSDKQQRRQ